MLQTAAKVFGVVFTLIGILGLIPGITTNGHLLGIFEVDTLHNLIHLVSGIAALYLGFKDEAGARLYFQVFGVVYGLVALLGLFSPQEPLLGIIAHNVADLWLHIVIAVSALALGFGPFDETEPSTTVQ